jgi:hypothetical protein
MSTATLIAKSMVRKAREVKEDKRVCAICDTIEFLVLMTLPFALPFLVIIASK